MASALDSGSTGFELGCVHRVVFLGKTTFIVPFST